MAIRAKTYVNRKKEKKLQVSGSVEEFQAIVDDKAALKDFLAVIRTTVSSDTEAEDDE